jgi:hypothetical protein
MGMKAPAPYAQRTQRCFDGCLLLDPHDVVLSDICAFVHNKRQSFVTSRALTTMFSGRKLFSNF